MLRSTQLARSFLRPSALPRAALPLRVAPSASSLSRTTFSRLYSESAAPQSEQPKEADAAPSPGDAQLQDLQKKLDDKDKAFAEMKDARLRLLADYENLQKISAREKQQAKDFALTSFAKDLISSIDVLHLALKSIPAERLDAGTNKDLTDLHEGVSLTKKSIEKVLARHGVVPFDPTGEQFDPNKHEALYQAPVPGKEPGSVLECQEIGYMLKDRLLRPAKVGVVLAQE
ncbi:hypothetical protein JCM1841_005977 [Sporobolomyces salmonicolor]